MPASLNSKQARGLNAKQVAQGVAGGHAPLASLHGFRTRAAQLGSGPKAAATSTSHIDSLREHLAVR